MPTFTIVSASKSPLAPNEINAGTTIPVSDGDVFIIDPSADQNITFEAAGGTPANFDVQMNASSAHTPEIVFETDLTPSVVIADNVDASGVTILAGNADAINFTAGNNVTFGAYHGSNDGIDTVLIGDGFTAADNWQTKDGADILHIGDDAVFMDLQTGDGDDVVNLGENATFTKLDGEEGSDTLNTQTTGLGEENFESTNVVCYAAGTLIDTPDGPLAVEVLKPGDQVITVDHGPQSVRWVRSREQNLENVAAMAKPVLIEAGALGDCLPSQDLIVSPQHRVVVGGAGQLHGAFCFEAFAPAKSLTRLPGIRHMKGKSRITWVHFACDRHEIVIANGCRSESLLLGPMVVNGLDASERRAVMAQFGPAMAIDAALNGPPARACLKVKYVRGLILERIHETHAAAATETQTWDRGMVSERYKVARAGAASLVH
ncbi:MAG: Hint domain-containing protein [Pseudomonadota bacterium]